MSRGAHSRGRALRTGVAWDMRTGMKTRGRKLMSDGERPGVYAEKGWVDQRHPSRYVNVPPPDGLNYRPGPPAMHAIGATVDLGTVVASDTTSLTDDGTSQQSADVLRRAFGPRLFGIGNIGALLVGSTFTFDQSLPTWDSIVASWDIV